MNKRIEHKNEGSSFMDVEAGSSRNSTFQSTPKLLKKESIADEWFIIE